MVLSALVVAVLLAGSGAPRHVAAAGGLRSPKLEVPGPDKSPLSPAATATPTPACGLLWRGTGPISPNTANSIAPLAPDDVWIGGTEGVSHWDGSQWTLSALYSYTINDLSALSSSDIWAVGYLNNGGTALSLTAHWDGVDWTIVPSPNPDPTYNALDGVKALAHNDVWAAGEETGVLHWNGSQWVQALVPSQNIYFRDIDALSANDVWVVGNQYALPSYTVAEHWNGATWSRLPGPNPSSNENVFQRVLEIAPDNVWAIGFQCCGSPALYHTLIEHWDGSQWTVVSSPDPGDTENRLAGIGAASPQDVWAVGSFRDSVTGGGALIEKWDGQSWSYIPLDQGPSGPGFLNSVAALSATDVWAAGWDALRYYDPCVTPAPSSTPTTSPTFAPPTATRTPAPTNSPQSTATATLPPSGTVGLTPTPQVTASATVTPTATPCSISFSDVHTGDYFYDAVTYLTCHGAISGYSDGTFRPYNNTTRGQLAKITVLARGWDIDTTGGPHFSDVLESNAFYSYIETAYHHDVISGYADGTFRWGNNVTRAQLTKVIVLAWGWPIAPPEQPTFRDVPPSDPFYGYIEAAYFRSIISGYSCGGGCLEFRPGNDATRGQIAKIVFSAIEVP